MKKLCRFSYSKNLENFEAFCWNISSSINLLFLKSGIIIPLNLYIFLHVFSNIYPIRERYQLIYFPSSMSTYLCQSKVFSSPAMTNHQTMKKPSWIRRRHTSQESNLGNYLKTKNIFFLCSCSCFSEINTQKTGNSGLDL